MTFKEIEDRVEEWSNRNEKVFVVLGIIGVVVGIALFAYSFMG